MGCPNDCVFCNQKAISGRQSPVLPEHVGEIVQKALDIIGDRPAEAAFYGGSFTAIKEARQEALLRAVKPFRDSGRVTKIRVSTRPDAITASRLDLLKSFGVETVELGAQSMIDTVLERAKRGHTAGDTEHAVKLLDEKGFQVILQMMTGLPGDSETGAVYTARRLAELLPEGIRIYPAVVIRGTELYSLYRAGLYKPQTVSEAVELCARLLEIFQEANIPVIRVGLNPTEELSGGEAVAGPYHPALGELARSRLYYHKAATALKPCFGAGEVVLGVHPRRISAMAGQKRENILRLQREFCIRRLKIRPADVEDGEICLQSSDIIGKIHGYDPS